MFHHVILLFVSLRMSASLLCYQCASELAVLNWTRYGFPITEGDLVSDNGCLKNETVSAQIACNGVCITYNVTREDSGKTIAVMRDCLSKNKMHRHKEAQCIVRPLHSRRSKLNVTSCVCQHDYCNGPSAPINRRAMRRFLANPSGAAALSCLPFIIAFLLFGN